MEIILRKTPNNLMPADAVQAELLEKLANGEYKCVLTRPRNLLFHRKYFALLNFAFEDWSYEGDYKNFEAFRKQIIVKSGYYDLVYTLSGKLVKQARSISFANMEEPEFNDLYSKSFDVILQHALVNYTKDDLERCICEIMSFA